MKGINGNWVTTLLIMIITTCGYSQSLGSLVVVNKEEDSVSILSLDSNLEVAKVSVGTGPHEVAVSKDGKLAAVCNYGTKTPGNSLSLVDVRNKRNIKTIDLGIYSRPHGIEFVNDEELIVTSEVQKALILVNVNTGKYWEVAKTDQLASHMLAYSKADQVAYVANVYSGTVSKIDIKKKKLTHHIPFANGIEGLDVTPDGKQLWVANRNDSTVTVVNTQTFEQVAVLRAHQIAFRVKCMSHGNYVVVSNGGSGNMSVYDTTVPKFMKDVAFHNLDKGVGMITVSEDPSNPSVPVGIATHPNGNFVYVALANYNLVAVVRTNDWTIIQTIRTGIQPDGIYHSTISTIP